MRFIDVKAENRELIKKVYTNEIESFGEMGGADIWQIMCFVRYGKLFVLVDENDELIGSAQFLKSMEENKVFLYGFSITEKYKRMGYGKKLLQESHNILENSCGIKKIALTVDPKNTPAINLYKGLEYEIIELQKDEYGEGVDRYLMVKSKP